MMEGLSVVCFVFAFVSGSGAFVVLLEHIFAIECQEEQGVRRRRLCNLVVLVAVFVASILTIGYLGGKEAEHDIQWITESGDSK